VDTIWTMSVSSTRPVRATPPARPVRGTPPTRPVRGTSLADEIAHRLQRDILDGRIALGERLAQDELCARFEVSRTPIREALTKLQSSGLVSLRPNLGAIVRTPPRREVQEVYELRAELEGFAAERAAARIDALGLRRLERTQEDLVAAVSGLDPAVADAGTELTTAIGAANDGFHDVILTAADNRALQRDAVRLRGCFPKDHVTEALRSVDELLALNVDEHERISAALVAGDAAAARRAMTDHVTHAGRLLVEYLDERRFWE
jgi:DNA-binding GntR family transcriptional regulator